MSAKDLIEQAVAGTDLARLVEVNEAQPDDEMTGYAKEAQVLCRLIGTRKPERVAKAMDKLKGSPQDVLRMLSSLSK